MKPFEVRALATANRLILRYGAPVIWQQPRDAPPNDPSEPWLPGPTVLTTFQNVPLVRLPSNRKNIAFLMYLTGTEIPDGYERAIIPGNVPFVPTLKDYFADVASDKVAISWLDPFKPAGNVLLWVMGLKP